jgi:hypothetical protein
MLRGGLSPTFDTAMPSSAGRVVERLYPPAMLCEP